MEIVGKKENITIHNYYTNAAENNSSEALRRTLKVNDKNSIVVGDFNLKHPLWNAENDYRLDNEAEALVDFTLDNNLTILNDGQVTRVADCNSCRDSALDLSMVSGNLVPLSSFAVINDTLGSDHLPILTTIQHPVQFNDNILPTKWLFEKATDIQWIEFQHLCKLNLNYNLKNQSVELNFQEFLEKLNKILEKTIHKSKPSKSRKKPINRGGPMNAPKQLN